MRHLIADITISDITTQPSRGRLGVFAVALVVLSGGFPALAVAQVQEQPPAVQEIEPSPQETEPARGYLDLLRARLAQTTVTLQEPTFRFVVGTDVSAITRLLPNVRTRVVDGQLIVLPSEGDQPIVTLDRLNFTAEVSAAETGRRIRIGRTRLLDHFDLSPDLIGKGLSLVAPALEGAAEISGRVSVDLETADVLVTRDGPVINNLAGAVTLHDAQWSTAPALQDVAALIGYTLGLPAPNTFRIAKESVTRFHVHQGRIHHDGLTFVLPDLSEDLLIRTSGSVGLDSTLDLRVFVQVPADLVAGRPLLTPFADRPIELRVTGTLSEPLTGFPPGSDLADQLAQQMVPTPDGQAEPMPAAIVRLVSRASEPVETRAQQIEQLTGTIFNLIRSIRASSRREVRRTRPRRVRPPKRRSRPRRP